MRQFDVKQGSYRNKSITAVLFTGTNVIQRFQYNDRPGEWFFPLIEDGKNIERESFRLEGENK